MQKYGPEEPIQIFLMMHCCYAFLNYAYYKSVGRTTLYVLLITFIVGCLGTERCKKRVTRDKSSPTPSR